MNNLKLTGRENRGIPSTCAGAFLCINILPRHFHAPLLPTLHSHVKTSSVLFFFSVLFFLSVLFSNPFFHQIFLLFFRFLLSMKSDSNGSVSPYSPKPRTRLVSSRFMSPNSTASPEPGSGSPLGRFNRLARKDSTTLADHIGNERLKEREEHHQHQNKKPTNRTGSVFSALTKQRSCREFRNNTNCLEENDQDREVVGRTTKNGVSGKSPSPSPVVKKPSSYFDPARHSLDENTFKGSFICAQNSIDSESENTSLDSVPLERTLSSRKLGREVSSKYMAACGRRGEASDS
ncbi:hypothetical protein VIGAN_06138400, partial [Vigna angularis var. angularis]